MEEYEHSQELSVVALDATTEPFIGSIRVDLPPPDTKRWVVRRKAVVVSAVRSGAISLEEACRRYKLSIEEFLAWQRAIDKHGVPGLRVTRIQVYRGAPPTIKR